MNLKKGIFFFQALQRVHMNLLAFMDIQGFPGGDVYTK